MQDAKLIAKNKRKIEKDKKRTKLIYISKLLILTKHSCKMYVFYFKYSNKISKKSMLKKICIQNIVIIGFKISNFKILHYIFIRLMIKSCFLWILILNISDAVRSGNNND